MFWEDIRNVKNVKVKIHLLFKRPHTPSPLVKARLDAHLFELGPYHYYPRWEFNPFYYNMYISFLKQELTL